MIIRNFRNCLTPSEESFVLHPKAFEKSWLFILGRLHILSRIGLVKRVIEISKGDNPVS